MDEWIIVVGVMIILQVWQLHKRVDAVLEEVKKLTQPNSLGRY